MCAVLQSQNAVSAYLQSKQILSFGFARQCRPIGDVHRCKYYRRKIRGSVIIARLSPIIERII